MHPCRLLSYQFSSVTEPPPLDPIAPLSRSKPRVATCQRHGRALAGLSRLVTRDNKSSAMGWSLLHPTMAIVVPAGSSVARRSPPQIVPSRVWVDVVLGA